jgi:hypothetical protein
MDACPGRLNKVSFSIEFESVSSMVGFYGYDYTGGSYMYDFNSGIWGQCSEFCGIGHGFMPIVIQSISPKQFFLYFDVFTFRLRPFFSPFKYAVTNGFLGYILAHPENFSDNGTLENSLTTFLTAVKRTEYINSHLYPSSIEYEYELFGAYSGDLVKVKEDAQTAFD